MGRFPKFSILLDDPHFIALNKPAGILSIPDRFDQNLPNLKSILTSQYIELFIVHRLDRETSGAVIFAKSPKSHKALSQLFQDQKIRKKYLAICYGQPIHEQGEIDLPIRELNNKRGKYHVHPKGKPALTKYKVIESFRRHSLLELDLITGRTHQIRVHLKALGHPLIVDNFYGHADAFYLSTIKGRKYNQGKNSEEKPLLSRSTLHAHKLQFQHPITHDELKIEAALPKDLRALLNQLRKWDSRS